MASTKNSIFYIGQFVAFILATITAVVYQFTANEMVVLFSLILYIVAFGMMATSQLLWVETLKRKMSKLDIKIKDDSEVQPEPNIVGDALSAVADENLQTIKDEQQTSDPLEIATETKKQITFSYVKAGFCMVLAVISFVVLVLF